MKKTLAWLFALMIMVLPMGSMAQAEEEKVLNLFTWDTYIDYETVIKPFTEATGIKVNYATFMSNEEMLTKLQASGGAEYDVILASDYVLNIARKAELLQPLDKAQLPNYENLKPQYLGQYFDPDSAYVIPYAAGTPLIIYDPARVEVEITGYDDLWNPALADSLVLIDDARNIIGMTMKTLGGSLNSTDEAMLAQAKDKLMTLKPNIRVLDYDTPHQAMISGEATVGYMFTPQVVWTLNERPDLKVVYPKEGMGFGIDGLVIPVKAPHPTNAHTFLNFLLTPEIGAAIAEVQLYVNPNQAADALLPESYLNNQALNIPADVLGDYEFMQDVGEQETLFQDIWTAFKQQ